MTADGTVHKLDMSGTGEEGTAVSSPAEPSGTMGGSEGQLPPWASAIKDALADLHRELVALRACGYLERTSHRRLRQLIRDLVVACEDGDAKVVLRRNQWAGNPDLNARHRALKQFTSSNPFWVIEQELVRDFMSERQWASMLRASKRFVETQARRNPRFPSVFADERRPLSEAALYLRTPAQYSRTEKRAVRRKRAVKKYAAAQLRIVSSIAILVCDCVAYGQGCNLSSEDAANYYRYSYAIAVGAFDSRWPAHKF